MKLNDLEIGWAINDAIEDMALNMRQALSMDVEASDQFNFTYRLKVEASGTLNKVASDVATAMIVPSSITSDVRELMRAVCAGSTTAIPKLVDELIGLGHQPDGDEPITDDWIVSEFGLRPCPDEAYDAVDFRDGSRVVFYRTFYRPSGQYVAVHNLVVTTRRDARSVMRMLQAFDANIQAADRPSGHDQHFGG